MNARDLTSTLFTAALLVGAAITTWGQGMPHESREAIHRLFNGHKEIRRDFKMTNRGYEAVTESDNPEIARAIKKHVSQMADRLKSGLMVRRWDPAFEEYVRHYDDIEHVFQPTRKGMKVIVTGKTADAVKVARNHAKVLAGFVADGWKAHDRRHAVALKPDEADTASYGGRGGRGCCLADKPGELSACCKTGKGGGETDAACCKSVKGDRKEPETRKACCKTGGERVGAGPKE